MEHDSTLYVGLGVHKDSITVAYAPGAGEVELPGKIGTTKTDIDRLCRRLQSKARHVRVVYEAGPCGYGLYRRLVEIYCHAALREFIRAWALDTKHSD